MRRRAFLARVAVHRNRTAPGIRTVDEGQRDRGGGISQRWLRVFAHEGRLGSGGRRFNSPVTAKW